MVVLKERPQSVTVTGHRYVVPMSSSTNTPASRAEPRAIDRTIRKALLSELPVALRVQHVEVLAHTLRSGVPVSPAALVVVLSAHDDMAEAPLRFSAEHVQELLWFGLAEFCEDYGIAMPDGCQEALHALLSISVATDVLDTDGDSVGEVFAALRQLSAC